ncbi:Hypothetical protein R9X50_00477500 [Acrodontium crateriforme]|uniref:Seipin n=1 Tax=Acrodontium crateriforme TaxID=150365 RepID=A0AAQ3RAE1_9PEZI|nr:Hypothetical protein R9X50_00477500 [Acrodontium crateriforme]
MATKGERLEYSDDNDSRRSGGLIAHLKSTALYPIQVALSKTAIRTYLTTVLIFISAFFLFACAVAGYVVFYWNYIPRIGFERVVHLQFDNVYHQPGIPGLSITRAPHPYPYGTVELLPDLVNAQSYDVVVELTLPRTRDNLEAGNFMLEATMHAAAAQDSASTSGSFIETVKDNLALALTPSGRVLASSRRPAIMPYRSWLVEQASQISQLHWYLVGWRQEDEKLRIPLFERVSFPKGATARNGNLPSTLKLEIQSTRNLQIYTVTAHFRARFQGLRWVMYNHRIISAVFFIGAFWMTEMLFAGVAWAVFSTYLVPFESKTKEHKSPSKRVKAESGTTSSSSEDEGAALSDTERTFPTTHDQLPLRYSSQRVKKEEPRDNEANTLESIPPYVQTPKADADDEEEDADIFLDSGLGTSMESSAARRDSIRRRRGRLAPGEQR